MKSLKLMKTLVAVGLITTAKIAANYLLEDPIGKKKEIKAEEELEIYKTNLASTLNDIRSEMVTEMNKLGPDEKLLKNYVRGRIATLNDIEKRGI